MGAFIFAQEHESLPSKMEGTEYVQNGTFILIIKFFYTENL